MIKAILFDWGGVLAKCNTRKAAQDMAKQFGVDEEKFFKRTWDFEDEFSEINDDSEFFETIAKEFNIPIKSYIASFVSSLPGEVFEFTKELHNKGHKVFILSNQIKTKTDYIREHYDISFFEHSFFSNEIGIVKPKKEIYNFVIKKINLKPEECVFIDDQQRNLDVASSLGWKTILFKNLEQLKKDLQELGVKIDN